VLLINSLQSGKAWQEFAQQTENSHSHTNSAVPRHVYVHALLVPAAYLLIDSYSTRHSRSLVFLQMRTALT